MARSSKDPAASLRQVPPREFTRARTALAERLAKSGRSAEARQVGRLPRPSPVVWALNQAALGKGRALAGLTESVDRLRRAQLGQGDLRAATAGYRTVFEAVVEAARAALREEGMKASPAVDRRLRSTLLAAVTDRGLRTELAAGRLAAEYAEPGFSVLSQGPIPAEFLRGRPARSPAGPERASRPAPPGQDVAAPGRARRSSAAERRARKQAEAAARREAKVSARAAQRAAREATRAVTALARAARRKEAEARAAEARVDALRATLRDHEARSATLRAAADEARTAHGRAVARRSET